MNLKLSIFIPFASQILLQVRSGVEDEDEDEGAITDEEGATTDEEGATTDEEGVRDMQMRTNRS